MVRLELVGRVQPELWQGRVQDKDSPVLPAFNWREAMSRTNRRERGLFPRTLLR